MDSSQNLIELFSHLRKLNIQLTADGDRLGCSAPKGALTPDLKEILKSRKPEILEFLTRNGQSAQLPPIERSSADGLSRPSLAQQRLWFLEQFDPGSSAYIISCPIHFKGALNRDALERSLREIILRHEVLRTSLLERDGSPMALVRPLPEWRMEHVDLPDMPEVQQIEELRRIATERNSRCFDLSSVPLMRACLVSFGAVSFACVMEFHHICCDGWSLGVLTDELAQLYSAFSAGAPSPLDELPIQYGDYARWHRKYIENGVMQSQLRYWEKKLQAPLPTLDLPSDHVRPPVMTFRGRRVLQELPFQLFESVRAFSVPANVTPFITLLTAFKALLLSYTHQPDIIIGTVTAGRSRPELERLVGLFVNNLTLRTDLDGDPTVREALARVKDTVLGAFAHEDVPFDYLADTLRLPRDLSRSPVFQIMFILQNFPLRNPVLPGVTAKSLELEGKTSRYDLTIEAIENDGRFCLTWEFNSDLFDSASIARMQEHYHRLLASLIANPDRRLSELELLTPEEMAQLTASTGRVDYPQDLCVHEWFARQATQTPEAAAVRCGSRKLTYRELDRRANQLAHRLVQLGVGPDIPVGVCLERSVEMAVALLAVLKAGGAYVPIDPQYPKDRIAFMLLDSDAPVLITTGHLLALFPEGHVQTVCLDRDWEALASMSGDSCPRSAAPDNLAYIIYTSGSTGKPKGVEVSHRSVVNFLASMQREPGISPCDRLLAVTTLSFDIAGLEFYLPLVSGAEVVIAPRDVVADGIALARLLEESGATVMQATPVTWRLLLESGWNGKADLKMLCGGEALPRDLAAKLLSCGKELWNLYGPTETTIWSTLHRVDLQEGSIPIGKPIANTDVYVLDEHRKPVPPGVSGELYIGGDGVARGYRGRPELTAERFIANPFRDGLRLYRTGDLARWLPGGHLECLGRVDNQVKVRGHRIELGEIEATLALQSGIKQAVVIVREDTPGDQRLTAYVIAGEQTPDFDSLRQALRSILPEYMIPSAVVCMDSFPLTPNRKVDRKRLPAPQNAAESSVAYTAPRTSAEKEVAAIWQDLLRGSRVGVDDNFFDLGGHSLLVVQLQSRLKQHFHREIPLVELFQRPTVSSMAILLGDAMLQAGVR